MTAPWLCVHYRREEHDLLIFEWLRGKISGCELPPTGCLQYALCCIHSFGDMVCVCVSRLAYAVFRRLRRYLVIFLKQHPSFLPMLIKEGEISTKPSASHLPLCSLSHLLQTCLLFSPSRLLCCLSAFIFSRRTSSPDLYLTSLSLFCWHFYICLLPFLLSALSLSLSFCQ